MNSTSLHSVLMTIVREKLGLHMLDLSGRDRLNFHGPHTGGIERALPLAYHAKKS